MSDLKFTIETKTLSHALNFASSVVEKRSVMPELSNVKISSVNGMLELIVTNMEIYLIQILPMQLLSEGQTTVSTKTITEIVKKISDEEIELKVSGELNQIQILGKQCKFDLLTLPVEQFPILEDIKNDLYFSIPCKDFLKIIDSTLFSVSLDETRYNLNGVYLSIKSNKCIATSTDGHRLSVSKVNIENQVKDFGIIVPKRALEEILKIIKDSKNILLDIKIATSLNRIKFSCNNVIMFSKVIDGVFPDYESFIPVNNNKHLIINVKLLIDVIDRISTVTIDRFQAIKFILSKNLVKITASGEARGVAEEIITNSSESKTFCAFDGTDVFTIGFNPRYLIESLNAILYSIKATRVKLSFSNQESPVLLRPLDNAEDLFVIMPVKV